MALRIKMRTGMLAFLACLASVWPVDAGAREKQFCADAWGIVTAEGFIVAADEERTSTATLCFGMATRRVQPGYPATAKADQVTGTIVVLAHVSGTGDVTSVEVKFGGHPALEQAARAAAMGWRFTPTTANDRPVAAFAQLVFRFREG
jgi:TonB family protein